MKKMCATKFCPECNSILFPKPDMEQKRLLYACRSCEYQEVADDPCVYRIYPSEENRTQASQSVDSDATLPRSKYVKCAKCGNREAFFFQATPKGQENLALFFICSNSKCQHRWRD